MDQISLIPNKIQTLDLSYIIERIAQQPFWTKNLAIKLAQQYKIFLALQLKYDKKVIPTKEVDLFWHQHILFTKRYHNDTKAIFGHFLHHTPLKKMIFDVNARYITMKVAYRDETGNILYHTRPRLFFFVFLIIKKYFYSFFQRLNKRTVYIFRRNIL